MRFLKLHGGGLDGLVLPIAVHHKSAPTHIAVYNPLARCWLAYGDGEIKAVDVYKIRTGCPLPTEVPRGHHTTIELDYDDLMSPQQAQHLEQMAQEHLRKAGPDQPA